MGRKQSLGEAIDNVFTRFLSFRCGRGEILVSSNLNLKNGGDNKFGFKMFPHCGRGGGWWAIKMEEFKSDKKILHCGTNVVDYSSPPPPPQPSCLGFPCFGQKA